MQNILLNNKSNKQPRDLARSIYADISSKQAESIIVVLKPPRDIHRWDLRMKKKKRQVGGSLHLYSKHIVSRRDGCTHTGRWIACDVYALLY